MFHAAPANCGMLGTLERFGILFDCPAARVSGKRFALPESSNRDCRRGHDHSGIAKGETDMAEAEDNKINGFAWFLAGLGIGALAGILYAPKSGRETRDDLANSAREGTEYLRNRGREMREQVGQMVDRGKEQVGEYVDRGREAVDRGRAQWEDFVERGKSLVGEQSSRVQAAVDAGRQAYKSGSTPGGSNMTSGSTTTGTTTGSATATPAPSTGNSGIS